MNCYLIPTIYPSKDITVQQNNLHNKGKEFVICYIFRRYKAWNNNQIGKEQSTCAQKTNLLENRYFGEGVYTFTNEILSRHDR